jgi:predicted dehydrogenase
VTLGAIALQGVRIAAPTIGENVAVIGLGLLGLLTIQILKANGCRTIGIDLDPAKVALAVELGADAAVTRNNDVKGAIAGFTDGVGADAVIITAATDSNDPIELSAEISRQRGRVAMVGAVKMDIPRKPFYEKELELRLSRSYGPGRYDPHYEEQGQDYPIGYVRWTERRNMQEFLRLVSSRQVTPARLVSHTFPIDRAESAYEVVMGKTGEPFTGVLLSYPARTFNGAGRTVTLAERKPASGDVGIGFIGAGNFARAILLPRFAKLKGARLQGISTANGRSGQTTGEKFGFAYATTDSSRLLSDPDVTAVVIATRHGSHARLAAEALRAGKAVFVEKPLAIDQAGLDEVMAAYTAQSLLTVGFNRRFSPLAVQLKNAFDPETRLAINYRINAGPIPADSWVHDPVEGGGRIIGEGCHFVDFVQFVTGDTPIEVFAHALSGPDGKLHDTVSITIKLARGSIATIDYFATGDKSFPKERVEVYGGGRVAVLDDFRELKVFRDGKSERTRKLVQDKGFDEEVAAFMAALRGGGVAPIPIESLVATTLATFAIEESLRTGSPVALLPG